VESITIYAAVKNHDFELIAINWVKCLLEKGEAACPRPDDLVNIGAWYSGNLVPPIWGIVLFLFFVSKDDWASLGEALTGNWEAIRVRRDQAKNWVSHAKFPSAKVGENGTNGTRFIRLPAPCALENVSSASTSFDKTKIQLVQDTDEGHTLVRVPAEGETAQRSNDAGNRSRQASDAPVTFHQPE